MTQVFRIHKSHPEKKIISAASECLKSGGVALVPTDTGYAFVADAVHELAKNRLLALRQSLPQNKHFSLLCKDMAQVAQLVQLPTSTFRVLSRYWPGPYTFLLEAKKKTEKFISEEKRRVVGVRISSHEVIRALLEECSGPMLTTSITDEEELIKNNYFQEEDDVQNAWWTKVNQILEKFPSHHIGCALDCFDHTPMSVSSVVDFTCSPPRLVRDGGWHLDFLETEE